MRPDADDQSCAHFAKDRLCSSFDGNAAPPFTFSLFDTQAGSCNNSMIKSEILGAVVVKGVTQYVRILCKTR